MKNYQHSTRLSNFATRSDSLSRDNFIERVKGGEGSAGRQTIYYGQQRVTIIYGTPPGCAIHNLARGRLQMVCPVLPSLEIISERYPSTSLRYERAKSHLLFLPWTFFWKLDLDRISPIRTGRASERRWSRASKSPLLSLRNEERGLSNYGISDINKVLQRSRWFLASDYDSRVYDKLAAVVYMKMSEVMNV